MKDSITIHSNRQEITIERWDACRIAHRIIEFAIRPQLEHILDCTYRVPYKDKIDYIIKKLEDELIMNNEFRDIFRDTVNKLSDEFDKIENEKDPDGARLKRMLHAYNSYSAEEFNNDPIESFPEDGILNLAYTTYEFEEKYNFSHEIQINFDVNKMKYQCYIDDVLVHEEDWDEETFDANMGADFDDLIRDAVHIGFDLGDEGYLEDDFLTEEVWKRYQEKH